MMSSILLNPQLIIYSAALLVRSFYRKKGFLNFNDFDELKNRDSVSIHFAAQKFLEKHAQTRINYA